MGATLVSRFLGFVRIAVIGAVFGASGSADVLNAVFNIPNNLRKLLAEGALSSAFIPVLSQGLADRAQREKGDPERLVRHVLMFQSLVLIPLLVLSVVFARKITGFILDFPELERQVLAADLFRWLIHYTLLISISAVLMGSLNSANRFAVPAFTPIVFSVFVIGSVLLLQRVLGVDAMVVGVLAGGVGQILFQTPSYLRSGFDFRPSFAFSDPLFRKVLRQWVPVLASSSIFVINQQVAVYFASGLEDGSTSALANAIVFWQLPLGVFGASVTTVLFPRMSREAAGEHPVDLRETVAYGIRAISALLIPSAIILALLSFETIAVLMQRGQFTAENTRMASRVLIAYCTGMVSVGTFNFLLRSFYARGDFVTPTITSLGVLVLDVAFSLVLKQTALRVAGLAVANSIAFTAGAGVLYGITRRALSGVHTGRVLKTVGKSLLACTPAAAGLIAFRVAGPSRLESGSNGGNLLLLAGLGVGSLLVVGTLYWILKMEAVTILLKRRSR
jgi:putative peptidoglycan lipid II flippase